MQTDKSHQRCKYLKMKHNNDRLNKRISYCIDVILLQSTNQEERSLIQYFRPGLHEHRSIDIFNDGVERKRQN